MINTVGCRNGAVAMSMFVWLDHITLIVLDLFKLFEYIDPHKENIVEVQLISIKGTLIKEFLVKLSSSWFVKKLDSLYFKTSFCAYFEVPQSNTPTVYRDPDSTDSLVC